MSNVAETEGRMFYSTELLPKGGKFNLVWLLSTTTSPGQLAKKRRKDLLKINIQVKWLVGSRSYFDSSSILNILF